MQYLLSVIFAGLLVTAQTSWKLGVDNVGSPFKSDLTILSAIRFLFSPLVLAGMVLYIVATLLYMYLLSRYEFSLVQSLAIPLSLIFSIVVAVSFFDEHLTLVNYAGLLIVVVGLVLVSLR